MAFTNAEKQRRFRARVNADPQRRAELLMKQRLRQKQKKTDGNSLVVPLYEKQDKELSVVRPEIRGLHRRVRQERYKRPSSDNSASSEAIQLQSAVQQEDMTAGKMQDSAERRVSHLSTATGVVRPDQSAPEVIQAGKKLVLVDQFNREYKRLQRPATAVTKTDRSLNLSETLHRGSLPDDHKGHYIDTSM